jgi:hypothetical protein
VAAAADSAILGFGILGPLAPGGQSLAPPAGATVREGYGCCCWKEAAARREEREEDERSSRCVAVAVVVEEQLL